ncbi:MAG: hypothetical protein A3D67_03665 [Candidatus Lloydbacteria bacterium RIFCSPHIGHO2_02_FULL_51_22]|uniref:Nudix hydrolase domain-containing protein n=3 Tax=Candidatus Lloydiibacteriota TaxID=1817910 RepID=A0A1G2DA29_9BACT|nr:MAG: hypothetical protein A3D67_03665 [Candidatus Lloydbacteria bacterium RIFCSPHIGHO2_02_FULL_51_22]OGZ14102.1 MAG: hypothetical protein A3J08_02055 [Candidatus Lloydbacteria bacterium RIFCSPLOWO2_02_FULL_51_11]OGZ16911.1 MAG: hypothetical protein A3G11_00320 [Candidatus Lloydbacteria bacterium RIFCSPLOWO2_12_FULL_51_9]
MNYSGVGVIVKNKEGKFLLHLRGGNTKRFTDQWCLIGGSPEEGEDPLVCAVREVREESNLTLENPSLLHAFNWDDKSIALIKGEVDTEKEKMILGEGAELRFFTVDEALKMLDSLEYTNPYLDQFKSHARGGSKR